MKSTYLWIAAAALAVWYFLLRKPAATYAQQIANAAGSSPSVDPQIAKAVATTAFGNWGVQGGLTVTQADQTYYPGWYQTSDGGWVNPDTGEFYSPGSSPVAQAYAPTYANGGIARPDLSAALITPDTTGSEPADEATSANNPANGYVIY